MTSVTIDPELATKLLSNGGKVLLTDASGKELGHFVALDYQEKPDRPADWMYQEPTIEEFRAAIANSKRWYTTEEVLKLLEE